MVVVDAIEVFSGLMNASWQISHTPSEISTRGTVKVSTTIVSEMARYLFRRMVRTNPTSLALMHERGGIRPSSMDTFFSTLPALMGQPVYWGRRGGSAAPGDILNSTYNSGDE